MSVFKYIEDAYCLDLMRIKHLKRVEEIEKVDGSYPWSHENFLGMIDSSEEGYNGFILTSKGSQKLVAYAVLLEQVREIQLLNFVVASAYQKQGLGSFFLAQLIHQAKIDNLLAMSLEVRQSNLIAKKLYEKAGFKQVGCRPDYYPAHPNSFVTQREDALVMRLVL